MRSKWIVRMAPDSFLTPVNKKLEIPTLILPDYRHLTRADHVYGHQTDYPGVK